MTSVFAKHDRKNYPYVYGGTLLVDNIFGGVPSDPRVAEGWLKTKLAPKDDLIREMVAETMAERGVNVEQATELVDIAKHLNGFKRDPERGGELYIEGRQLKAAIKEAASVAMAAGKIMARGWGATNKGIQSWVAEHIFVIEDRLYLGVTEPTDVEQGFVHTFRGNGIQYNEYVEEAKINFTIETDYQFTEEQWAAIWLTGQRQGIGASRSQGRGTYEVIRWEQLELPTTTRARGGAKKGAAN